MIYSVEIEAFGHVRITNIEAKSEADALYKAQAAIGYKADVTPQPTLDHTHTGAITR